MRRPNAQYDFLDASRLEVISGGSGGRRRRPTIVTLVGWIKQGWFRNERISSRAML